MIIGIGTDLVEINRIIKAFEKESFRNRLYTGNELLLIGDNYTRAADNFAVKEAVAKALGVGFGKECWPGDIEVLRDTKGKPYIKLYGDSELTAGSLGINRWHVSITNTKEYSSVFVIAEG